MIVAVAVAVAVVLVIYVVSLYNGLVRLRQNRENAFADIDVQLKQRHDLIPQLIETVKGYMNHESSVLTKVTEARSNAMNATSIDAKIGAENQLGSALSGLKVAFEAYPDLKANQNFINLQMEMSDIENKLAASRRFFNSATKELNVSVQSFPSNMVAKSFGFTEKEMFNLGEEERKVLDEAPKVSFD